MTCAHVLDLIDAGPLVACRREHLESARQHARGCAVCAAALQASAALTQSLKDLAHPPPPTGFGDRVMARIARLDEGHAGAAHGGAPSRIPSRVLEWESWLPAAGALQAGAAVAIVMALTQATGESTDVSASVQPEWIDVASPWSAVLFASLMVYAATLYVPLRHPSDVEGIDVGG